MGPLEILHSPAWQPLTWTLLHFVWQGAIVALVWLALFRLCRGCRTQYRYLLGLAGMFLMAACPVATFVVLESRSELTLLPETSCHGETPLHCNGGALGSNKNFAEVTLDERTVGAVPDMPAVRSDAMPWRLTLTRRIGDVQPYLLGGWIVGLVFFSGRLLLGVAGAHRLGRGRLAVSGEIAHRAAAIAARLGFRAVPRVFSSGAAREAVVTGLLRPMVLLPVAWLAEMPPEVLEAVIAHELAHIRRFDLWLNLFQRIVETLLFYHPAVWWLSRRVRLAREMCCDEMAAVATGERVVYATALELAARKRLKPPKSLLEVALGVTRMTLLDRVRNVLGLAARHEQGRWWPAAVLTLLVPPAIWLASMSAATSAQEKKPEKEKRQTDFRKGIDLNGAARTIQVDDNVPSNSDYAVISGTISGPAHTATAFLRIAMQEAPLAGGGQILVDRDRFEIYKNTQEMLLRSRFVVRAALSNSAVKKLASVKRHQASGDAEKWLADRLRVSFPGKAELMKVSINGDDSKVDSKEAVTLVNAVVDAYLAEVVNAETDKKGQRLSELEKVCDSKAQEMRGKREQLKALAAQGGASDSETFQLKQKLALEEVALNRQELAKSQADMRHYRVELAVQEEFLQDATNTDRATIRKEIRRLEVSMAVPKDQMADLSKAIQVARREAENLGTQSVDVEMLRADIKRLDAASSEFYAEREKLKVEIKATPRVTLLERAE